MGGSQPAAGGELHPRHPDCPAPPADTRRVSDFAPPSLSRDKSRVHADDRSRLCLHVLSSFQRTGALSPPGLSPCGEPYNTTERSRPCQPLPDSRSAPCAIVRDGACAKGVGIGCEWRTKKLLLLTGSNSSGRLAGSRSVQRIYARLRRVSTSAVRTPTPAQAGRSLTTCWSFRPFRRTMTFPPIASAAVSRARGRSCRARGRTSGPSPGPRESCLLSAPPGASGP